MPDANPRGRVETGVPGLDEVLCGGFWEGSVTIVQGSPGAGKTILANQICFTHAGRGGRSVYVTLLAESHDQLLMNLRPMGFYDEAAVSQSIFYISAFATVQSEGLKGLLRLLTRERERRNASLIVLDGMFSLEEAEDSDAPFRRIINELGNLASITRTTILLLTNSRRSSGSPEYTMVDGWLELGNAQVDYRSFRYLQVHKSRGSDSLPGQHQTDVSDEGLRVYPRLESLRRRGERPRRAKKLSTGVAELDAMTSGGIDAGSMVVVGGPTGVGKTSLGLHFVGESSRSEPGLIMGFYENDQDLIDKGQGLGMDLAGMREAGAVDILWYPPVEALIDELGHVLLENVRARGVKRLLVDGMEAFRQASLFPERLGRFFTALAVRLKDLGVTTVFTVETSTRDALELPLPMGPVSAVAEYIVVLRYVERPETIERTLTIRKSRRSAFDPRIRPFAVTRDGIVIRDTGPGER